MRRLFNCGRYYRRAQNGEFTEVRKRPPGNAHPSSGQPLGSKSETIRYIDKNNQQVATVHRFIWPSGIGTKHDPKKIIKNGVVYQSFKDDQPIAKWLTLWERVNCVLAKVSLFVKR
jgi:hypothetical protein